MFILKILKIQQLENTIMHDIIALLSLIISKIIFQNQKGTKTKLLTKKTENVSESTIAHQSF